MNKLLFISNVDSFFISHRLPIAIATLKQGYEVHLATKITSKSNFDILNDSGLIIHRVNIDRSSLSIFRFLRLFITIFRLIASVKPQIIHSITIKPVLIGGIVSRFFPRCFFIASVPGLGYIFNNTSLRINLLKYLISLLYRLSFAKKRKKVIFQNSYDKLVLSKICNIKNDDTILIPGSGIDLNVYKPINLFPQKPVVLFASRLLRSKGVIEFVNASKKIPEAEFWIAGQLDPENPDGIDPNLLVDWQSIDSIKYLGFCENMYELINKCSLFVLPSFYSEGFPKVLIEAAACGKPVVTTDHPGCRDAVVDGKTGILVPPRDTNSLVSAIQAIIFDKELQISMGINSRLRAEKYFNIDDVVNTHIDLYSKI